VLATSIAEQPWRVRLAVGMGVGAGLNYPGLWWMKEFSLPGYLIFALLETALVAAIALATPAGRWRWLGLPAALVVSEAVRGAWPFGGVPVVTLAETQVGGPLAQAARLGGPLLVAGLVGVAGAGLKALARGRRRVAPMALATVVVATLVGAAVTDGHAIGSVTAALVQGGGERGTRAIDTSAQRVYDAHRRATDQVRAGTDLVLWPEDVVDVEDPIAGTPLAAQLAELADRHATTLVAGVVENAPGRRFRNFAQAWGTTGQMGGSYVKHQRVPFGEYIPFRSLIKHLADLSPVPRDATVGHGPAVLETEAGRLGVAISYEVFFDRRARAAIRGGGEILVVPTNASSYPSTQMPALELGAARMRAIETGRWVLQAAPTGFSAAVDPRGRVRARSDLGRRQVIQLRVARRSGQTPYTRLGDGPVVLIALLLLASAWALSRRDDQRPLARSSVVRR